MRNKIDHQIRMMYPVCKTIQQKLMSLEKKFEE